MWAQRTHIDCLALLERGSTLSPTHELIYNTEYRKPRAILTHDPEVVSQMAALKTEQRRRGRPVGSVSLTPELERTILSYIEAGSFDYIAAEAAGIDGRTFRDWIARGEGRHPTRKRTPQLRAFSDKVRQARARARASREIQIADRDPKFWLQHAARSKVGRDGWSEPIGAPEEDPAAMPPYQPDQAELSQIFAVLVEAGVLELEPCGDQNCRCQRHGGEDADDN